MTAQLSFADAIAAVTPEQVTELTTSLVAGLTARAMFEMDKNPANDNIQKSISKLMRGLTTEGVVRALSLSAADAGVINTTEVKDKRRNVYALEKMRDLLYGAVTGHPKNAINIAVLKSLKALEGSVHPFTGLVAKACASDKVAVDTALKGLLTRHIVSESTASTQASSTMTALEDLGVVKNTGSRQFPVYQLVPGVLTERLLAIV